MDTIDECKNSANFSDALLVTQTDSPLPSLPVVRRAGTSRRKKNECGIFSDRDLQQLKLYPVINDLSRYSSSHKYVVNSDCNVSGDSRKENREPEREQNCTKIAVIPMRSPKAQNLDKRDDRA